MKSIFGKPQQRSLARSRTNVKSTTTSSIVQWPDTPTQEHKDYRVITTREELLQYFDRCKMTGLCSFDWETGPSQAEHERWEEELGTLMDKRDLIEENLKLATTKTQIRAITALLKTHDKLIDSREENYNYSPLDPHRAEICTVSLSAVPHEARVLFLSHEEGSLGYEHDTLAFMLDFQQYILMNKSVKKIAYNLNFETKMSLKYGVYIGMPAIDPFVMIVRTLQAIKPNEIVDPKLPAKDKGLKQMTLRWLKVKMNEFTSVVEDSGHNFFNEMSSDDPTALLYSAEDSDYSLQLYLYFDEIARQIKIDREIIKYGRHYNLINADGTELSGMCKDDDVYDKPYANYSEWLHAIEMPFARVVGQMEFHGFTWNKEKAQETTQLAEDAMENAKDTISQIGRNFYDKTSQKFTNLIKQKVGIEFYEDYHDMIYDLSIDELKENFGEDKVNELEDLIERSEKKLEEISSIKNIDPGKTGKNGEVRFLLFDVLKCPIAERSEKTDKPKMDHNSILDMRFMVRHKLITLDDEEYIDIDIPKSGSLTPVQIRAQEILNSNPYEYANEILELLDAIEKVQKFGVLLSSHIYGREKYLHPMTGRIHARFTPWTETSRLNSSRPNGQNVPRPDTDEFGIRNVYQAAPGKVLLLIDYSGFELRLMAWASKDENMLDIFNSNGDMHRKTAATLTGKKEEDITKEERISAKSGNFGIGYCGTAWALQRTYKKFGSRRSLEYCDKVVTAVKNTYPRIPLWQQECAAISRKTGYAETIFGYRRLLPYINSMDRKSRSGDERRASNTPIQGSAADIMKKAQNAVYDKIAHDTLKEDETGVRQLFAHTRVNQIQQFHDELVLEVDNDIEIIKAVVEWTVNTMQEEPIPNFPLKLIAEPEIAVKGWGDKEDYYEWLERQGE